VFALSKIVTTEFNIEGYPTEDFLKLLAEVKPVQATLVPDPPDVLTSNAGWNTVKHKEFLKDIVHRIKEMGIRTSIFIEPDETMILNAADTGTDRVELYTENYARNYAANAPQAVAPYLQAAQAAQEVKLGLNAGHDLSLQNLRYFKEHIPALLEVSIGHALISDALYLGLENTIQLYRRQLV
jgi:pyridoxine 5-phosphate synthase